MFKTTSKSQVLTESGTVEKNGYTSIELTNIGTDDATVNENIPLPAGGSYSWQNYPGVIIDENTSVRFKGVEDDKRVLVQMFYIKQI